MNTLDTLASGGRKNNWYKINKCEILNFKQNPPNWYLSKTPPNKSLRGKKKKLNPVSIIIQNMGYVSPCIKYLPLKLNRNTHVAH